MLSRRQFVAGALSGWSVGALAGLPPLSAAASLGQVDPAEIQWLRQRLPAEDQRYDPFAKLLASPAASLPGSRFSARSGHVHGINDSMAYALAQFDTGMDWRIERGREMLRVLLTLQDHDPASASYGLWPWCLEEPRAADPASAPAMATAGAQLCAALLLTAWRAQRTTGGRPLADAMRDAIIHAARAIQARPEAALNTTTRAVLETGIALGAAQEFKLDDLRAWARARLRSLYDHVLRDKLLLEGNSPEDTVFAVQELSRMRWLIKDGREQTLIEPLHELAWQQVATRFHAPTRQWAGPHLHSRNTDLRSEPALQAFLQKASNVAIHPGPAELLPLSLEAWRVPVSCPRRWRRQFIQLDAPRQIIERCVNGASSPAGALNPIVATTWLHRRIALGSVNRADLGGEQRPLLAYWGTAAATRCLRVRCLCNQHDFASALLFTAQHEGAILAAVVFATDRADHAGGIQDLRVRFELEGDLGGVTVRAEHNPDLELVLQDAKTRLVLQPVAGAFGDRSFQWDEPELKLADRVDVVAAIAEGKPADLTSLGEAFVCFTLEDRSPEPKRRPSSVPRVERTSDRLRVTWAARGRTLELSVPTRPGPAALLNDSFRSRVGAA